MSLNCDDLLLCSPLRYKDMGIAPHSKALICIYLNFGEDGGYTTLDICQTTLKSGTLLHTECFIEA